MIFATDRTVIKRVLLKSFLRGLVQRCPIPVKNLITFGSPHQVNNLKGKPLINPNPNLEEELFINPNCFPGSLWNSRLYTCNRYNLEFIIYGIAFSNIAKRPTYLFDCFTYEEAPMTHKTHFLNYEEILQEALSFASW